MSVKEIMHAATIISPDTSVLEVAKIMRDKNIGSVLVKISELEYGIVTERDIVLKVIAKDADPKSITARDIITELRYTIDANASIQKASEIFNLHPIRRLPVMEKGEIIGIITARDVAKRWAFDYYDKKRQYIKSKEWR